MALNAVAEGARDRYVCRQISDGSQLISRAKTSMACCCTFEETVDEQFTSKKAGRELERYRRKGAGSTTPLIEGLSEAGRCRRHASGC